MEWRQEDQDNPEVAAQRAVAFNEHYEESCRWVDKRRARWDLHLLSWEDARQRILIRIWRKCLLYDPAKGEYSHWVNKLISQEIKNIWRDHYTSFSRPCILGCIHNMGEGQCSKTPSGTQCSECPIYADWFKRKGDHFAVKQTLPLETHVNEVHSKQGDFPDYETMEERLHARVRKRLTRTEWRMYRLLVIKGLAPEEVAKQMGFKAKKGRKKQRMFPGYSQILSCRHRFEQIAREVVQEEGLAA